MPISITKGINFNSSGSAVINNEIIFNQASNFNNTSNFNQISNFNGVNFYRDIVSSTTSSIIIDFSLKNYVLLKINSSGSTSIRLSIPTGTNAFENLYLLVKSNGNYIFSSGTVQGGTIRWPSDFNPAISNNSRYDLYSFLTNGVDVFTTFAFNYNGII